MSYKSAVYGFTVGNLVGAPYVGLRRGAFKVSADVRLASAWTEDVSLMLATADSLRMVEQIDRVVIERMMTAYERFMFDGAYTADGIVRRVGTSTSRAIQNYRTGIPVAKCGALLNEENGSGAIKRVLPLAYLSEWAEDEDIEKVSSITHAQTVNNLACIRYVRALENNGVIESRLRELPSVHIRSNGYVLNTLDAAMWCVMTTESYRECVLKAVALGYDTDTVAALAGGLAGERYGFDDIPVEWLEQVPAREVIDACM